MTKGQHTNPFFGPYNTPHDTVPFNNISLEDFEEAFMEGIRRDNEQIEKTINNPDKPTFDNTIINVDDDKDGYYDLLSRNLTNSNIFSRLIHTFAAFCQTHEKPTHVYIQQTLRPSGRLFPRFFLRKSEQIERPDEHRQFYRHRRFQRRGFCRLRRQM